MDMLAQVLTKYRTSAPIGSGLNNNMMKSRKLIGAQFLKIKTSYLRETESCVQSVWIFFVYFELTNYKKYIVFFMEGFFSGRYV